jgi:hypothetical protein
MNSAKRQKIESTRWSLLPFLFCGLGCTVPIVEALMQTTPKLIVKSLIEALEHDTSSMTPAGWRKRPARYLTNVELFEGRLHYTSSIAYNRGHRLIHLESSVNIVGFCKTIRSLVAEYTQELCREHKNLQIGFRGTRLKVLKLAGFTHLFAKK